MRTYEVNGETVTTCDMVSLSPWRMAWEGSLQAGDSVDVVWGYGSGFRAHGTGVIERVFGKSFRVKLTEETKNHTGTWPAGFVLKGIPRAVAWERWHYECAVYPAGVLSDEKART